MNILLIFDEYTVLSSIPKLTSQDKVSLFPLTGDLSLTDKVIKRLNSYSIKDIELINSSLAVEEEFTRLRKGIFQWTGDIGNYIVRNRSIKEWFLLNGYNVSSWWFGILSEKNTAKTDSFLHMAQINAIKKLISGYDMVAISLSNKSVEKSIIKMAKKLKINHLILNVSSSKSFKIKEFLYKFGIIGELVIGLGVLVRFIYRKISMNYALGNYRLRKYEEKSLLFVSYYPAIDNTAAKEGIFRNKYCIPLQDKFKELNIPVTWLFIYVPLDGHNLSGGLNLAKDFIRTGEKLFFIEEFLDFTDCLKALYLWVIQVIKASFLFAGVKYVLTSEPAGKECEEAVKNLWFKSFFGSSGMEGIVYYLMFKKAFKYIYTVNPCLYYCEMHHWEKALNAAKTPGMKTIAFQHTITPKNLLNYFYDPSETLRKGEPTDMPLPDILAANGELTHSLLSSCGYPGLTRVEAVRHLYLKKILDTDCPLSDRKCNLLVAGSINLSEIKAMSSMVIWAFSGKGNYKIWFKSHPAMPFEKAFAELGVNFSQTGFNLVKDNIADLLKDVSVVFVPSSSVSIEAIAMGCEVIVPFFPNSIQMNPVADFENLYHKVTSGEELASIMENIEKGKILNDLKKSREFVNRYWDINPELPGWTQLLRSEF